MAETSYHVFLHYRFAVHVWYAVTSWVGVVAVLPADAMVSYGPGGVSLLCGWLIYGCFGGLETTEYSIMSMAMAPAEDTEGL
ncbi:hypothetical protein TSUD_363390 [Trifolium subterraneum]|uniref:Uncharacterized protein n=1 Tax=Trifolium subterraneum TaxID=3900 RepID=A0A2Z6MLN1_TRISU|nr:hypothetical protein TSUD_363390 [Trifolium subterraneum]